METWLIVVSVPIGLVVGWPIWLAIRAINRAFLAKEKYDEFTILTPDEYTGSLIEEFGEAGFTVAEKLSELYQKGKSDE